MVSEEKVRLMTQAATTYNKQEKRAIRINEYYKRDYISLNMIKSVLAFTLAYTVIVGMIVIYNLEWIFVHAGRDLILLAVTAVLIYILAGIMFAITSYRVYDKKYQEAKTEIKKYQQQLLKISNLHNSEKESGRRDSYVD